MKKITPKNLFFTLLLSVFSIGISMNGYAQCGVESITTDQWCENGFAKWTFDAPTANTWYEWYSYTPAPYVAADFDANGHLIRTGSIFYDSTQSTSYYSPFRITTATAPPAGVQLTYIKRTSYPAVNPKPAVAPAFTSNASGTVMEMTFTNTMPVRFNSIKVPVVLNTVGQNYKIQITFGTTGGPGSAVYNFSTVGATLISGNNYYIEVPINYTLTTVGTTKIVVNSNPTGTGAAVDGLLFSPTQPATTTSGPITIPANSASTTGGKFGVLYDWNYTAICPPQTTPLSTKKTVGCCVAPASINILTLSSNKATIVNGSGTAILTVGNYSSTSNYFDWYLNGVNVPAASGAGKISYTTNQVGNWEVHELTGASPSVADKTNPSCYSSDVTRIDDKLIFASIVTAPSHSPLCIGDTWSLSGSGSSNLTWSTGGGTLSNSSGPTTDFTASQVGTTQVILTGTVTSNDLVVNGNFSAGTTGFVTSLPGPVDPRSTDGSYNVAASAGNWGAQGDWTFNGTKPFVTGNPGNFLVVNGEDASSITKPVVWGQKINGLTANQAYTFSFDFTSICYVVSANTGGYSNAPGTAPFYDVELEVYINGILVGSASTDFALNGGVNAVGIWKNHSYTWNSATSSFANIEIRQKNLFPMRGYDFGLDNIKFGGLQTQTDAVTIGPITDCSAITATASACVNDSYTDLTAVASGGLIFDHWELKSSGATVSTANPYRVQTLTATQYDAVGYMGIGNVLSNGDFNSGDIGFTSGSPYYNVAGSGHGDNQYSVDVDISTHNPGWWINLPQAPGQPAGSMRFFADAKAARAGQPSGQVIAWNFTAAQNAKFAFSGYFANIHKDVVGDTVNSGRPAAIGIYINNVLIASYWSINDLNWHQLLGNWTAPLAGTNSYTLEVRDLKRTDAGGSDFALDDFRLVPLTGTPKKFTVTTPVCNPCLLNVPTVTTSTFCGNVGTVKLTPAATDPFPTSVEWSWYDAATAGTKLGTSVGNGTATLDVTGVPIVSGNKTVYYTRSIDGSGMVGAKPACTFNYDNIDKYSQKIVVYKDISITGLKFMAQGNGTGNKTTSIRWATNNPSANSNNGGPNAFTTYAPSATTYNIVSTSTPVEVTMDFTAAPLVLTGSAAGTVYYLSLTGGDKAGVIQGCGGLPVTDNIAGQTIVDMTRSLDYGNNPTTANFGSTYDIKFSLAPYPCPRVPVVLTPSCPCTKPSAVVITAPASTPTTLCQGTAQTLSGTATVAAASINGGFTYSWRKGSTALNAPTVITPTLTVGTASAVPSNTTAITGLVADAGTYTLRVEDGTAGNSSCYTEATVVINVNPTTVPGVIAGAQTICTGGNPAAFTVTTAASGGDGTTYAYQWESDIVTSGTYSAIAAATNATYDEGVLNNAGTTPKIINYRRKVTSGACPQVISNVISITVNPAVVAGVVATDQTICSGGDPAAFTQTTAPTGGSGTYTYQWESSSISPFSTYTPIASATNATYDAPTGLTATTRYRRVDGSGTCATATTAFVTVTVQPTTTAGVIAAAQTICTGGDPAAFTVSTAAGGGNGTFAYVWESDITTSGTYAPITGATNATYDEGVLTNAGTTAKVINYRRKVTSGTCPQVTSNVISITVNPAVVPGVVAGDQTICSGGNPAAFTQTTAASGGSGTYTYQWESSSVSPFSAYTPIASATNTTYDAPTGLTATTHYRRVVASGTCATATTNDITVTVTPNVTPSVVIATPATTICTGTSVTFTATPTNGGTIPTYQWYKGPVGSGAIIGSATNATYTTTTAANNDSYYVIMTSTAACPSPATATSNAVVMTVTTIVTPAVSITAAPAGPICAGTSVTFTASPGNGGLLPTYQWKINNSNSGAVTTTATFTPAALANGDQISVVMTSNSTCVVAPGTATSNVITMVVNPNVTPAVSIAVSPTGAICTGASLTFTATPTNGGTPTYQWYKGPVGSGTLIGSATNATYTTATAANNDSYYVIMTSSLTCVTSATATSTAIVTTVNPILVPSVTLAASPATICTNGSTTFTATPVNPGAAPLYEWFIKTGSGSFVSQGAPAASATFSTTLLTSSTDVVQVTLTSNALCATPTTASATRSVTVNAGIGSGTIGITTATICYNTIPGAISQTVAPTGIAGTPTYTWEASPTGLAGSFVTIPLATGISYTPTVALTQDAYIRRVITDPGTPIPCNVATSNTIHIIVNPQLVAGVIAGNETTCANVSTATITSISTPTGGTGSYTYQWQSSATAGGPYTNIGSATNATYSPGILTTTTYFVRVETSGTCGNVTSNEITKTVTTPEVMTASINNAPSQVCASATSIVFTATGATSTGTLSYQWYLGPVSTANKVGTNSSTYTYSPVLAADNGKQVRVVISTSNTCNTGAATSAPYTLDIVNAITPTVTISGNNTNCAGLVSTFTASSTGGGTSPGPTYQWYVNSNTNPVGTGGTIYSTSSLANGDKVYVEMTSSSGCLAAGLTNPFKSNEITMVIKPIPAPAITEGDQTICTPNNFTFHGIVTAGNTYEWRLNGTTVVGTGPDLTTSQSGTYTLFEDNGTCNSTSQPVTLNVIQTPVANAGADIFIRQGEAGSLNGSGGAVYSWSPSTYLSSASVSNPTFTATQTITYVLTVSDATNTCSTTDAVNVFVVKPIIVPNVITVNGDGSNDDWYLENIEGYPNSVIEIYNRWGNLVWKSEGYPKNWDGTNYRNGEVLSDGTYFYIINLHSEVYDEPLTGWVQIIK